MVFTIGHGRMAAMVRLLAAGSSSEITSEEAAHKKIAVQTFQRELVNANESNLLEEGDMHVFGCRPLEDPLHLVCCNACKKPIKASQYAAHAGRCMPLNPAEASPLKLDGGIDLKKPPRKVRRSLQETNGNNGKIVCKQQKPESMDTNGVSASNLKPDDQSSILSSSSREAQNVPVPLATKIYHSQGNRRLRLALGHLYHGTLVKDCDPGTRISELTQERTTLSLQVSSPSKSVHEVQTPSSELCLKTSGGLPSSISFSDHFTDSDFSRRELQVGAAPVGMSKARHHSTSYSYSSDTGTAVGTMQQVN